MARNLQLTLFLAVTLAQWPVVADAADWVEESTAGNFRIHAEFPLSAYPQLVPELTRLERDLTASLALGPTREPIHLFLFRDKASFTRYMERYFEGAPTRRALFIKGKGPGWVFAYRNPQFEIDVRHESTHALLHSRLPMVPLWLDEGLAEYFEVAEAERAHGNPHLSPTRWAARFYRAGSLRELEELRGVRQMGKSEYRAAWAWIHFLLHGPSAARDVLITYLRDIAADVPPGRFSERLGSAMPDSQKRFLRHFRSWRQ